jgi:hypothetical protein
VGGLVLGALTMYMLGSTQSGTDNAPQLVKPQSLSCEADLALERSRVRELEQKMSETLQQKIAVGAGSSPDDEFKRSQSPSETPLHDAESRERAMAWRISTIEKFVSLDESQRQRLREKFQQERDAQSEGREQQSETLEEIIGEEKATLYRQQVQAAFERVQNQELDKESVWLSRKLGLSSQQEQQMRAAFISVESQIDREFESNPHGDGGSPQARVSKMIAQNRRRVQLRADALKPVLQPEQLQEYLKEESQSAAADMEVFHEAPQ